jgi:hypothetical protein
MYLFIVVLAMNAYLLEVQELWWWIMLIGGEHCLLDWWQSLYNCDSKLSRNKCPPGERCGRLSCGSNVPHWLQFSFFLAIKVISYCINLRKHLSQMKWQGFKTGMFLTCFSHDMLSLHQSSKNTITGMVMTLFIESINIIHSIAD